MELRLAVWDVEKDQDGSLDIYVEMLDAAGSKQFPTETGEDHGLEVLISFLNMQ